MKKIITLAVVGLTIVACDPYNSEPSGTPAVRSAVITGRNAGLESVVFGWPDEYNGPYNGTLNTATNTWTNFKSPADKLDPPLTPQDPTPSPTAATYGRILVFTTNVLLDGTTIEQTPNSCLPVAASNWVFTVPAGHPTNGAWYTCYYPSSATASDGASVYVYYASTAPGPATAAQPIRAGRMVAGNYAVSGTIKAKDGQSLELKAAWTVTDVP